MGKICAYLGLQPSFFIFESIFVNFETVFVNIITVLLILQLYLDVNGMMTFCNNMLQILAKS